MVKDVAIKDPNVLLFKRISWTAIFVGALVGVGLVFLLNLFGFAIGLSTFTFNKDGAIVLAIGGLAGVIIGVIIAMLVAGYVAGYLGRLYCPLRNLGFLYGFLTWTVTLLLSAIITAHVGNYVNSYSNIVSHSLSVVPDGNKNGKLVVVETNPSAGNQKSIKLTASPNLLAWSAFIAFGLFFIGALACCVGASWGMACKRND